jgi:hypothetical protein
MNIKNITVIKLIIKFIKFYLLFMVILIFVFSPLNLNFYSISEDFLIQNFENFQDLFINYMNNPNNLPNGHVIPHELLDNNIQFNHNQIDQLILDLYFAVLICLLLGLNYEIFVNNILP